MTRLFALGALVESNVILTPRSRFSLVVDGPPSRSQTSRPPLGSPCISQRTPSRPQRRLSQSPSGSPGEIAYGTRSRPSRSFLPDANRRHAGQHGVARRPAVPAGDRGKGAAEHVGQRTLRERGPDGAAAKIGQRIAEGHRAERVGVVRLRCPGCVDRRDDTRPDAGRGVREVAAPRDREPHDRCGRRASGRRRAASARCPRARRGGDSAAWRRTIRRPGLRAASARRPAVSCPAACPRRRRTVSWRPMLKRRAMTLSSRWAHRTSPALRAVRARHPARRNPRSSSLVLGAFSRSSVRRNTTPDHACE